VRPGDKTATSDLLREIPVESVLDPPSLYEPHNDLPSYIYLIKAFQIIQKYKINKQIESDAFFSLMRLLSVQVLFYPFHILGQL
jgi:hypothetical protein